MAVRTFSSPPPRGEPDLRADRVGQTSGSPWSWRAEEERREEVIVKARGTLDLQRESVERVHLRAAELEEDRLSLEEALAPLQERLAQADHALHEKEALLLQSRNSLQEAERALHDKEALLQQTRRTLELLRGDHAHLRSYLLELKRTPLFKLQELLTKLSKRL